MDTCPACNSSFDAPTATGLCPSCEAADAAPRKPSAALIALAVSAVPFVVSFGTSSRHSVTMNGVTESTVSGIDYVAVGLGGLGAVLGVLAAVKSSQGGDKRAMGIAVGAILLGGYHVARGLYLF